MLAVMSGTHLRQRLFVIVTAIVLAWSCGRLLLFDDVWPRALELRLESFSFSSVDSLFTVAPTLCVLGLLGMVFGWGQGPRVRSSAGAVVIWSLWACTGPIEANSFFDQWIPAMTMMTVLGSQLWSLHRKPIISGILSVAAIGSWSQFDLQTTTQVSQINMDRQIELKQAQGMARFIRWRFLPDEWVAVHSPGAVPYHARRPFIDLSGTTEVEAVSASWVMKRSPSGILPENNFISTRPMRLPLGESYQELVDKQYKQYAIQQQKKWKLVRAHPVWFHIYIRKDLPMLSPDISEEEGNQFPKAETVESAPKSLD
jgi:hypothetical protein